MDALPSSAGQPVTGAVPEVRPLNDAEEAAATPEPATGKSRKKKSEAVASNAGRSVEVAEPQHHGLSTVKASPNQGQAIKSESTLLSHRKAFSFSQNRNCALLSSSTKLIDRFISDNQLGDLSFDYNLATGYSEQSKQALETVSHLKEMIDRHIKLFKEIRSTIVPRDTRKFPPHVIKAQIVLKQYLWEQCNMMLDNYYIICKTRLNCLYGCISSIPADTKSSEISKYYEELISDSNSPSFKYYQN